MTSEFAHEIMLDADTDKNEPFKGPPKVVTAFVVTALNWVVSDTFELCVVGAVRACVRACCKWQGSEPNKEKAIEEFGPDFCTLTDLRAPWSRVLLEKLTSKLCR